MSIELGTKRLLRRPWRDKDAAAFAELSADPAVMEYLLPRPGWVDRKRAHWLEHGFGQWVVEIPGEASFIGVVGLETVSYEAHFTPAVEVAWRLARPYWSRGYATEAAQASLDYGFGQLGLAEIVALTMPANRRSRRLMEGLGMTRVPEGRLKRHVLYRLRNPKTGAL